MFWLFVDGLLLVTGCGDLKLKDCIGWIDLNSSFKNLGESIGWSHNGSDVGHLEFFFFLRHIEGFIDRFHIS